MNEPPNLPPITRPRARIEALDAALWEQFIAGVHRIQPTIAAWVQARREDGFRLSEVQRVLGEMHKKAREARGGGLVTPDGA